MIDVNGNQKVQVFIDRPFVSFLMRIMKLKTGRRYNIVFDFDAVHGPSWSISDLGKIEREYRSSNGNGNTG